jgi:hypothetical protein
MAAFDTLVGAALQRLRGVGARHSRIGPYGNDRNSRYSVLRERPFGSIPVTSLWRSCEPRGRVSARAESSPSGAPRARASFLLSCPRLRVPAVTTHPVRAPVGWLSRCAAVLVQRGSRPRRALCSPLRIPKRARASLFSKLQRANGECLGA